MNHRRINPRPPLGRPSDALDPVAIDGHATPFTVTPRIMTVFSDRGEVETVSPADRLASGAFC